MRSRKTRAWGVGILFGAAIGLFVAGRGTERTMAVEAPVGLSLFFQNSSMPTTTVVGDRLRYPQEIDIVATTPPSNVDTGISPLINNSEFSSLDWAGVMQVEEDWRSPDGVSFTRQRFYRGAAWMNKQSHFQVFPVDAAGNLGQPLFASAGKDDDWKPADDGFIRRFTARQIATGCPSVGNCSGATFVAQGLAQWRDALHADATARTIPQNAVALALRWSDDNSRDRIVQIAHATPSAFPYGYGFAPSLDRVTNPGNGSFFLPGDSVSFRVTFRDGQGNRLHPLGSLPTYGQFIRGEITSGLRYFDGFALSPTLYYALKHRESNLTVTLSGPINQLRTPITTVGFDQFFLPQATVASVPVDGFTAVALGIPPFGVTFIPPAWDTPVSDLVTFQIPSNAAAGTYVAAVKARRDFGGEALNRGTTTDIQVGSATASTFTPKTGNCSTCHTGPSALGNVLHGISDRRACYSCHAALVFEPDAALDIRVHEVHDRSNRFAANIQNCSVCHLTPPPGPARGVLP